MPIATPEGNNPLTGVMQSIMLRYHADMEAQVEHTLADLAGRWQGVRASLLTSITRLERQMQAAVNAGDTITYTWLAQQARLLDLKAAVAGDIAAYAAGARDIIGQAQGDAAELGLAAAHAKLDALTPPGVNYTWGVPPRDVLDQIAGATQPYTPLYALFEQMGAQAATNAAQALFQSVALGEGPREAARRLVWATDMSARRAEVIARTEIHRAWRQAQFANYQANSDVVSSWMWSADFASERTCGACIALDGSIHPLDEELADHVCGRCDAIPVTRPWSDILAGTGIPDDELAALDEGDASTWMDYRESGGEWLARQPIDTQNRVLGPAKAEAWRQGAISLRDVAGITHDPTWGRSIEERSLKSLGLDAQKWLAAARSNGTAATTMSEEARSAISEWEQQRAAAIAEVKAAEAEAASGAAARPSEWEARRAAAIAEAEGFGAPASATQALEGVGAPAETSPVWQQIADALKQTPYSGPTADYLAQADAYLAPRVAQYAALHPEMTLDEYKAAVTAKFQQLLADATPSVRVPSDVLDQILSDGRLKTSFEVGKFGEGVDSVAFYNNQRAAFEAGAFGYAADIPAELRPISGYLTDPGADNGLAMHYGDARLILTADARNRVTATFADSLSYAGQMTPRSLGDMTWDAYNWPSRTNTISPDMQAMYQLGLQSHDPLGWQTIADYSENTSYGYSGMYVEMQVHGGVSLSDIQEIVFTGQTAPDAALTARLDAQGISWSYAPTDNPLE